jgi:UDP-N-acetylmuramoyl-tripeptide--D-alanyl-D-alanine ligase
VNIAQPSHHGLITNIGESPFSEGFGGIEGVIKGKGELFDFMKAMDQEPIYLPASHNIASCRSPPSVVCADVIVANHALPTELIEAKPIISFRCANGSVVESHLPGICSSESVPMALAIGKYFGLSGTKNAWREFAPMYQLIIVHNSSE